MDALTRFSVDPTFAPQFAALGEMYRVPAGRLLSNDPDAKALRDAQRAEHHVLKGGRPEFRITEPIRGMADLVDREVMGVWTDLTESGLVIPVAVRDRFMDDLTHRSSFPER